MEALTVILLAFAGLIGAALAKIMADDFKAWSPKIVAWILGLAVKTLPIPERERYAEEWMGFLAEVPGDLSKVVAAVGLVIAAGRMSSLPARFAKRSMDLAFALVLIGLLLPLFITSAVLVKMTSPGPILYRHRRRGMNGKGIYLYKFRVQTSDSGLTKFGQLLLVAVEDLPGLLNVLKGDIGFLGPPLNSSSEHPGRPGLAPNFRELLHAFWKWFVEKKV